MYHPHLPTNLVARQEGSHPNGVQRNDAFWISGPIHTGLEHPNLWTIPLMLLASSVNTTIHNRFHFIASRLRVQCGLGLSWPTQNARDEQQPFLES